MMKRIIIWIQIATLSVLLSSCLSDDRGEDCGIYLEFIYDYNMEYANTFSPQVKVVDALVFDADGKYLFSRRAEQSQLLNGNQMLLGDEMPLGKYQVITVGGLYDDFLCSDESGGEFQPGITSIEQVQLSLINESQEVSHQFQHLWFGGVTTFENTEDKVVCPVHLTKNTNRFHLIFINNNGSNPVPGESSKYTFEIVTPESAVYSYKNEPIIEEVMTYKPYYLAPETEPGNTSIGHLNTCRLFYRDDYSYRLIVRNKQNQSVLWDYDLMVLLMHTKPANPINGSEIPMQEYLDRQSEWNMTIIYKNDSGGDEGFIAIGVKINDWILWLKDIEV